MKKAIATLSLFVCLMSVSQAGLIQWEVENGGNGHWYELVTTEEKVLWTDAMMDSANRGGHLVTITTEEEDDWLILNVFDDYAWIGATQNHLSVNYSEPYGGWEWITGENFIYTNWEMNNSGDQSFLMYDPTIQKWNDLGIGNIGTVKQYVVEYVPEPASISLFAIGTLTMLRRRKR